MPSIPPELLDVTLRDGRAWPRWLTERDAGWVEELQDAVLARVGMPQRELGRELQTAPRVLPGRGRARAALLRLLLQRHGFVPGDGLDPVLVRRLLFDEAAAAPPGFPRPAVVARVSQILDATPDVVEEALYADLPGERRLAPLADPPCPGRLIEQYNLALAQGMLQRAESVAAEVGGQVKAVLRYARLQQLICTVKAPASPGGKATIQLSGPLSLFRSTLKYGRALANWLPTLARAPGWSLCAHCRLRGEAVLFRADASDPLGTTHAAPRRFDSRLEERFFRELQAQRTSWTVLREADPVQVGTHLICPDFTLVDHARGVRVPVEIVGWWTPAYLRHKAALIAALPLGSPWLLCLDRRLDAGELEDLPTTTPVFQFQRKIPVTEFLRFLEEWITAVSTAPVREGTDLGTSLPPAGRSALPGPQRDRGGPREDKNVTLGRT
ncbi:MAG: DUF790 family protein [Myxococcota bacterium]|jgi:predicted nuclease of restriction endonuclease-like RecB superfamily|nr:DUF790 family protein [Myxococcota bacterium]